MHIKCLACSLVHRNFSVNGNHNDGDDDDDVDSCNCVLIILVGNTAD